MSERRDHVDELLRDARDDAPPPPPCPELLAELEGCCAVTCRRPRRQLLMAVGASVVTAIALTGALSLRRDLSELPTLWYVLFGATWFAGFLVPLWLALVPPRGQVLPRARVAGIAGLAAAAALAALGLTTAQIAPSSTVSPDGLAAFANQALPCLALGHLAAIVPSVIGVWMLRNSAPVAAAWVAAALGAAGGALGGLVLHLHCPVADPQHVGFAHAGVIALAALWVALAARKILRP